MIHQTRTRTVHVRARRNHRSPAAQTPPAPRLVEPVSQPGVVAQAPVQVRSRVSPTGGERETRDE